MGLRKRNQVMKIAFVDLGRHYGGVENYILSLTKAWKEAGNECVILCRKDSALHHKLLQEGFAEETVPVEFRLESIRETKRRMKEEHIELFHINGINSGVFVNLLHLPVKQVTTVHGNAMYDRIDKNILIQKLFVWLENTCLKRSHGIISVSASIKDLLVKRGIDISKIAVIYNGIEAIEYDLEKRDVTNTFRMCFVGRLEKVKGCEYLIRALAKIKNSDYICDIYGEGSLREELEQLAGELGIDNKVCFKGFSDEIRSNLNQYDVLVQPSLFEAFPLALLEAMNARVLIVCSDIGGMREIVKDGENGLKFEVGNIEELAEKMVWAMKHKDQVSAMKEKAFSRFHKEYKKEVMYENTFRLLERVYDEI